MSNSKKALFFINSLSGGGAEKVALIIAEQLYKNNIQSVFVTLYKNKKVKIPKYIQNWNLNFNEDKCALKTISNFLFLKHKIKKNKTWKKFLEQYKIEDFCLITSHLPMSHKLTMSSPYKNKCIYTMHLSQQFIPKVLQPINKIFLKTYYVNKKISCVSNGLKNELINKFKLNAKNIKCIYNPVNIKKSKCEKKIHNRDFCIIVGRLCKQKNQQKAIKIYNNLNLKDKLDLIIIGNGKDKNKLQKQIRKKNLEDNIKIEHYQSNINDWMQQAQFLISTSKYEGFSMVVAESLILETPVISTNCNYGPSEILTGKLNGFLIDLDAKDRIWEDKISQVLNKKYPKIDQKEFNKFQPNTICKEYLSFYEN